MDVAYTWSQFKYVSPESIDGHWLPNSPEHMLNLGVDYQVVPQSASASRARCRVTGGWTPKAWHRCRGSRCGARRELPVAHGRDRGRVSFAARNIFGASYMAFTEPDFDDTGGIVVDVWNSFQPGPKQEYFARVSLSR